MQPTWPAGFDEAMREQHARMRARIAAGMPRAGWKVCINEARMQKKLGIPASFPGMLDGSRHLASGDAWTIGPGSVPGLEPEIAVSFRARVDPSTDEAGIEQAVAGIAPALEIVDWKDARLDLASIVAGSSFHAGFVTGEMRPLSSAPEITASCPRLSRAGAVAATPDPALMPERIPQLVARLTALLARYGEAIEAGDWLLCGACTAPLRIDAGDVVEAGFGALGSVSVRFA